MPKAKSAPAPASAPAPDAATTITAPVASSPLTHALPPGAPPLLASSNPDQFVSVGLANNFNGRVHSLYAVARRVEKSRPAKMMLYELFAELNILADDHTLGKEGIVTEYYKMDSLAQWVPSRVDPVWDGQRWVYTPAGSSNGQPATLDAYLALAMGQTGWPSAEFNPDGSVKWALLPPEDWKGYFLIPGKQNSRTGLMQGTKWQQFTKELKRAEYDKKAPHVNWADFRQFLVGVYGTWIRLPFEFSGGQAPTMGEGDRKIETLCLANILDLGPISGNGSPVSVTVPATAPAPAPVTPAPAVSVSTPTAAAPAAAPVAGSPLGGKDPAVVSAALNEILTALALSKGAAGATKQEAGRAAFEQLTARGLDGALGLRWVNDLEWMEGDERTFAYDAARGLVVPLPAR